MEEQDVKIIAVSWFELRHWEKTATIGDSPFYELLMADGRVPLNASPLSVHQDDMRMAAVYRYVIKEKV